MLPITSSSNAPLDNLFSIAATGNTSDTPIVPPVTVANVSATGPTSSPNCLAISILSACCAIPEVTPKAPGTVNAGLLKYSLVNNFCGVLVRTCPTFAAPKNGTKEPTPSASLVVHKSS